jgi:hypothetical protein
MPFADDGIASARPGVRYNRLRRIMIITGSTIYRDYWQYLLSRSCNAPLQRVLS